MSDGELTAGQFPVVTAAVDIEAPPPPDQPTALVLFGTNQFAAPVQIAAEHYRRGTAKLMIATGGANRHNGVVEGREFARELTRAGVPAKAIRVEDVSSNTSLNVELALDHLREALDAGLRLVAVSKWYHLRAVYSLRTWLPESAPFYATSWEPYYAGALVTRESWPGIPAGRQRVIREFKEVPRRVTEGSYARAEKRDGLWWLQAQLILWGSEMRFGVPCGQLGSDALLMDAEDLLAADPQLGKVDRPTDRCLLEPGLAGRGSDATGQCCSASGTQSAPAAGGAL